MSRRVDSLKHVMECCRDDILTGLDSRLTSVILYGSFTYQNLDTSMSDFGWLKGEKGALDKKPDFIAAVSGIESAIENFGRSKGWAEKDIKKVLSEEKNTPFYFNVETNQEFDVLLREKSEKSKLPYKIGIIGDEYVLGNCIIEGRNIYLASRLSKPFNLVYSRKNAPKLIEANLEKVRKCFSELALQSLPQEFTGEEFIDKYIKVTYLAEAYRLFDIVNEKHRRIVEGIFYDLEKGKAVQMKEKLAEILSGNLTANEDIALIENNPDFCSSKFKKKKKSEPISTFCKYAGFNMFSFFVSVGKNRRTNRIGGGSNKDYVMRKIRR